MHLAKYSALLLAAICAACTRSPSPESVKPGADIVFTNAAVYTANTGQAWASAVAVSGRDIIYVGDDAGARELIGENTRTIELGGQMLLPGFHDTHMHPVSGGLGLTIECNVAGLLSLERILPHVRECASRLDDAAWLVGSGWSTGQFPDQGPNKDAFDDIPGNHPIYLTDEGGHSAWVNQLALERAGIDADTENPLAGIIVRDDGGDATGTLREHAMYLVADLIPAASTEQRMNALRVAMQYANSFGITSLVDAMVDKESYKLYVDLANRDELTTRIFLAHYLRPDWDGDLQGLVDRREFRSEMLEANQVKLWMDGVMESQTAAVKSPYVGQPDNFGILSYPDEFVLKWVPALEAEGFQLHMHTIGDAAVAQALNALELSRQINGAPNRRPYLIHNYLVDVDDYPRILASGATANFTMLWNQMDPVMVDATLPYVTEEQADNFMPMAQVHEAGVVVTGGSDWPVTQISPLPSIQVAVTGKAAPYHPGMPFLPEQPVKPGVRVNLDTMIRAYTINAAYAAMKEDTLGSIEIGKRADIVVLARNLFEIDPMDIHDVPVTLTMVNGKIVFEADP